MLKDILCLSPSHVIGKRKEAEQDTQSEARTSILVGGTQTIMPLKEAKRPRLGPKENQGEANLPTSRSVRATSAVEKLGSRCPGPPSLPLLRLPQEGKENSGPNNRCSSTSRSHSTRQPLVSPLSFLGRLVRKHNSEARQDIPCSSGAKQLRFY